MITYYTCTQVTPEVYTAYLRYSPRGIPFSFHELQAITLCVKYKKITLYPVSRNLNARHLREFKSTDPQSIDGDSNILVSVEEFFNQLFMFELEQ